MTNLPARCQWCGAELRTSGGPGRPARYCRRSHRQRHYEARRAATARRLDPDDVLISREQLGEWRDRIYLLAAALEDTDRDLAGCPTLRDYTEAFLHLHAAAGAVTEFRIEPRAMD